MPHLFTNRQRRHDLSAAPGQAGRQFVWETVNAVLYKIGGVVFIIGSILFFPRFEAYADLGAWTFFFGSLLYLVVTGHDAIEVWRSRRDMTGRSIRGLLEVIAAGGYLIGTLLFTIGSILFLSSVGLTTAGAWLSMSTSKTKLKRLELISSGAGRLTEKSGSGLTFPN